jgi:hypothetical protein
MAERGKIDITSTRIHYHSLVWLRRDRRGRARVVVGFTTACAISAYHH